MTEKNVENISSETKEAPKVTPTFTKEQLINSKRYEMRQDAISALLEDGKKYTIAQVDKILDNFYKGKGGKK